jgi:malate dehydrogenase (oxaloacetate-decarboxylating)(NADP+)
MDIPVFHDDQHGTAIIARRGPDQRAAPVRPKIEGLPLVCNGAGAAAIACIELVKAMGARHENMHRLRHQGRDLQGRTEGMNQWKSAHAVETEAAHAGRGDGRRGRLPRRQVKGAVTQDMVKSMADNPMIFAMANPDPEITPEEVAEVRVDAIVATGAVRLSQPGQQCPRLSLHLFAARWMCAPAPSTTR